MFFCGVITMFQSHIYFLFVNSGKALYFLMETNGNLIEMQNQLFYITLALLFS